MKDIPSYDKQAKFLVNNGGECGINHKCQQCVLTHINGGHVLLCTRGLAVALSKDYLKTCPEGRMDSIWEEGDNDNRDV